MSDVRCPKCSHAQEINHDDGYGYEEGELHVQRCVKCGYEFEYLTAIIFDYEVRCKESDHKMEPTETHPNVSYCEHCDYCHVELTND